MKIIKISLIITIVILISAFIYYSLPTDTKYSTSQKEKALGDLLGRKVNLEDSKPREDITYSDKYISFKYPGNASVYTYKDPTFASRSGILATFSYDLRNPRVVANFVASKREDINSLSDDPAFTLRSNPSRGYKSEIIKKLDGVLFKRDGQENERSLFLMKDGVEYYFILTGTDPKKLDSLISLIVSSFKFIK